MKCTDARLNVLMNSLRTQKRLNQHEQVRSIGISDVVRTAGKQTVCLTVLGPQ